MGEGPRPSDIASWPRSVRTAVSWPDATERDVSWPDATEHDVAWSDATEHDVSWPDATEHDVSWPDATEHDVTMSGLVEHNASWPGLARPPTTSHQADRKIVPIGVPGNDQTDFPGARPALQAGLALDRTGHVFVRFGVDQAVQ